MNSSALHGVEPDQHAFGGRVLVVTADDGIETLIEAGPLGGAAAWLRRRPATYGVAATVLALAAGAWRDWAAWWIAVSLFSMAAAAIARGPRLETAISLSADVLALGAAVVFIGLEPTSGMALWSAIVAASFFALRRRQAWGLLAVTVLTIVVTFGGDERWALLELTDAARSWVSVALSALGFAYLASTLPALASVTRRVVRTAGEAAEAQRREAESRAHLASVVAHELRNPLAGIRGFLDLLVSQSESLSPAERDEYLQIVASQAVTLEGIVEDLLISVQKERGTVSVDEVVFDVGDLLRRAVRESGPGEVDRIAIDVPPDCRATGDPPRVAQIVRNLLSNARKYGGPNIALTCRVDDRRVVVTVSDDGPGIPEADVQRAFERFVGTGRGSRGYGLGLPISRELAQAMGGDLAYEPGQGATFVLTLLSA